MIVYVNGDSHSTGAEVDNGCCFAEDDSRYRSLGRQGHPDNIRLSYGQHVADYLGATLLCDAESAGSNDRIIRTTWKHLQGVQGWPVVKPDLIIIGWSTWEREEWLHNNIYYQITASGTDQLPDELVQQYKNWVLDQGFVTTERKMLMWHKKIWEFHRSLETLGIPHLFFNTYSDFSNIRNQQITTHNAPTPPPEYNWEGCYIDPYDHDKTYYYWCLNRGFKTVNPNSYHFGADAHRAWAEFLIQNYTQKLLTQ